MKKAIYLFILAGLCFQNSQAQVTMKKDPVISAMVSGISSANIEKTIRDLAAFHTRHNMSAKDKPGYGIGAAWKYIYDSFSSYVTASGGRLSVRYETYEAGGKGLRIPHKTELKNVVATLKGTDPYDDRIIVISAHLDSRVEADTDSTGFAPGADDDASGIAALIEMVRIMSSLQFPATIVWVAFSGEEHGLLGASYMAKKAKDENLNIVAMLNNDMIGNSLSGGTLMRDNMRVRVFSEGIPAVETSEMTSIRKMTSGENDSNARQLARYIKETGERYVDMIEVSLVYRNDRFGRGGDHTPFCQQGFTAVRICEYFENYDRTHKTPGTVTGVEYGDLPEYVDFEYVRKVAAVNLATISNMAMAPCPPENTGIVVAGLTNYTTLTWSAPQKGKKPVGYYVMMRETSQPVWEKKIWTEDTSIILPYSKDNYFFAVQSVDAEGHESVGVFPAPLRK